MLIKQTLGNEAELDLLMLKAEMSVEGISVTSNWVNLLPMVINLPAKPGNGFEADIFLVGIFKATKINFIKFPSASGFLFHFPH